MTLQPANRPDDPRTGLGPWQIAFALGTAAGTWFFIQLIIRSLT